MSNPPNGESAKSGAETATVTVGLPKDCMARFRPPFTPSNSLLLRRRSPPLITVTHSTTAPLPSALPCATELEQKERDAESIASSSVPSAATEPPSMVHHPPQPFPLPLRRRSSTSSPSSCASPAVTGARHSMPRLSITSLGSVAKTFQSIAAFIVPEEEGERERARDRLRMSLRRKGHSIVEERVRKESIAEGTRKVSNGRPKWTAAEQRGQMRSSPFARPNLRSSSQTRPTPLPRQNGQPSKQQSRDSSRSRTAGHNSATTGRAPSVPVTPKNKRYAHVKSKVGSITDYTPPPSQVKIFHQQVKVNATPKVGSLQNASHVPAGGNVKIENRKLNFRETATPKVEAKSAVPIPKSEKKIATQKLVWKAEAKIGSLENANHKSGGGNIKIFNEPVRVKAEGKVGSLDNIGHVPGGGNVKISDYSNNIGGAGSVRSASRRDTADSGQSSVSAGAVQKSPHPANGDPVSVEITMSPKRSPHPTEIELTPRGVPGQEDDDKRRAAAPTKMPAPYENNVAEGELINF